MAGRVASYECGAGLPHCNCCLNVGQTVCPTSTHSSVDLKLGSQMSRLKTSDERCGLFDRCITHNSEPK